MRKPNFRMYAKRKMQISWAVTARLISAFVFAKLIVQSIFFPNFKPLSISFGCTYRFVLDQVRNPENKWSCGTAYIRITYNEPKLNFVFKCAKTKWQISCIVTAHLINTLVFAIKIVQSLYFLNFRPLPMYPVCVRPARKPRRQVFSQCSFVLHIMRHFARFTIAYEPRYMKT